MSSLKIEDLQSDNLTDLNDEESVVVSGGILRVIGVYGQLARAVKWAVENGGEVYGESTGNGVLEALRFGNLGA